jgi:hypothetical protein
MSTFESFSDLQKSTQFEDQLIHDFFVKLVDSLFDKHDNIIINSECETEKNQQLIKDQCKFISLNFHVPKRVFSTQKCVRQTLKHMVEFLNNHYQFKKPMQFQPIRKTVRVGENTFATSYSVFSLI